MKNCAVLPQEIPNLAEIQQELRDFFFHQQAITTEEEAIDAIKYSGNSIMLFKGMPENTIHLFAPEFNEFLKTFESKYGKPVEHNFWAACPGGMHPPAHNNGDPIAKLWIPVIVPPGVRFNWFNYSGTETPQVTTNNGVNFLAYYTADTPSLLQLDQSKEVNQPSFCRIDRYYTIMNFTKGFCLYSSIHFENQETLLTDYFSE